MREPSKMLPPALFFWAVLILVLAHFLVPISTWITPPWTWVSVLPLVIGLVLVVQPARVFEKRETTIKPFQESTTLVNDGFFRLSRNPMYLGMVLVLTGLAIFFGTVSPFGVPVVFMWVLTRRFVVPEEAILHETFGAQYEAYCRNVRRWI